VVGSSSSSSLLLLRGVIIFLKVFFIPAAIFSAGVGPSPALACKKKRENKKNEGLLFLTLRAKTAMFNRQDRGHDIISSPDSRI